MADPLDEFIEFDAMMGADTIKCPHRGATVAKSLLFDDVEFKKSIAELKQELSFL